MKSTLLVLSVLILSYYNAYSQDNNDYIVTIKNDTNLCEITKTRLRSIICYQNDKKIKFKAKDILGYKKGEASFESGKGRIMIVGWKRWVFFHKIMSGKLNLYAIEVTEKSTGGTLERRATDNLSGHYYFTTTLFYARRSSTPRGKFSKLGMNWRKNLKKICFDCPEFIEKIDSGGYWVTIFDDKIKFFNDNCGN